MESEPKVTISGLRNAVHDDGLILLTELNGTDEFNNGNVFNGTWSSASSERDGRPAPHE